MHDEIDDDEQELIDIAELHGTAVTDGDEYDECDIELHFELYEHDTNIIEVEVDDDDYIQILVLHQ